MNAKMPEIKACFESAGFLEVRTLLSSGNVAFDTQSRSISAIERRAEKAMRTRLNRSFDTFVRPTQHLQEFVNSDPFAEFKLSSEFKPVVAFLRDPVTQELELPQPRDGASILRVSGSEVLAAYIPSPKGPAFMALLERTFGRSITTRTLATVRKCAWA